MSPVKVIVDIDTCQKVGNGIFVRVLLLLNHLHKFLKLRAPPFVDDESSCQVT